MPRVLIVDDEPAICHVVGEGLKEQGIDYEEAYDGEAALLKLCHATADGAHYDAVVLDIAMPIIDGWHVLEAIKSNPLWENMRVVVLTGHATSVDDIERIMAHDGVYVEKTGSFPHLLESIMGRLVNNV